MKSPTRGGVAVGLPGVGGGGPVGVPGGGAWWHARLYGPEGGYPSQPGTLRIQCKYLVPIYIFPEIKNCYRKTP
jgi:hypothetical protein